MAAAAVVQGGGRSEAPVVTLQRGLHRYALRQAREARAARAQHGARAGNQWQRPAAAWRGGRRLGRQRTYGVGARVGARQARSRAQSAPRAHRLPQSPLLGQPDDGRHPWARRPRHSRSVGGAPLRDGARPEAAAAQVRRGAIPSQPAEQLLSDCASQELLVADGDVGAPADHRAGPLEAIPLRLTPAGT